LEELPIKLFQELNLGSSFRHPLYEFFVISLHHLTSKYTVFIVFAFYSSNRIPRSAKYFVFYTRSLSSRPNRNAM